MATDVQQLERIISDTKKLIALAEDGQWDQVVELELLRDAGIKLLFTSKPDIDSERLAEGIQFILDKNKILSQYSYSQCDSIRMEIAKTTHAHKAINTYLST
tara:strand:- start:860 stop:1165 length:306 start_codon:yes stop_codon:yes gene_type:complete